MWRHRIADRIALDLQTGFDTGGEVEAREGLIDPPQLASAALFEAAARDSGVPLTVLPVASSAARAIYGCDLALTRPDQHVAWRGNVAPDDCDSLLARVTGR